MCDKSRMTGDCHVRFRERLGVKFPRPTRLSTRRGGVLTAGADGLDAAVVSDRKSGGAGREARAVICSGTAAPEGVRRALSSVCCR